MSYDTGYKKSKKTDDEESAGVLRLSINIFIGSIAIRRIEKAKQQY
jgi:hypothetical protein